MQDFGPTSLSFNLVNVSIVDNKQWFENVGPENEYQTKMKSQLRKGGANALNVYLVSFSNSQSAGLLGYSTFPATYDEAPLDDGVVVLFTSLPGGTSVPFDEGRTLTHEGDPSEHLNDLER